MSDQYDDLYSFEDKPKRKAKVEDTITWNDAYKALAIFAGSVTVMTVLARVLQQLVVGDKLAAYWGIFSTNNPNNPALVLYNPVVSIIATVVSLIVSVLGLLLIYGVIHLVATKVMNGAGTYPGLIVRGNWWSLGAILINGLLSTVYSFYLINHVVDRFGSPGAALSPQFQQDMLSLSMPMYVIMGVVWLVWVIGLSTVSAQNYRTSMTKGCATLAVSHVIFGALYCGLSFAIGLLFLSSNSAAF